MISAAQILCDENRPGVNWAALNIITLQDCSDANNAPFKPVLLQLLQIQFC